MIQLVHTMAENIKIEGAIETLVIEDNRDDAYSVKRVLESCETADFKVRAVHTLAAGLKELKRGTTNVVLLDLHLSDAQGTDLVKAIKDAAPNIGLIVVTGWPIDEIKEEVKAAGADAVLSKPVDPSTLAIRLQYSVLYHRTGAAQFREVIERTLNKLGEAIGDLAIRATQNVNESGAHRFPPILPPKE
jgi:CheY-like chemotaxis protein